MTTPDQLQLLADMAECPDDAMVTDAIVLVSYHDTDGEARMGMSTHGDALLTSRLGLLAWATITLATQEDE